MYFNKYVLVKSLILVYVLKFTLSGLHTDKGNCIGRNRKDRLKSKGNVSYMSV